MTGDDSMRRFKRCLALWVPGLLLLGGLERLGRQDWFARPRRLRRSRTSRPRKIRPVPPIISGSLQPS